MNPFQLSQTYTIKLDIYKNIPMQIIKQLKIFYTVFFENNSNIFHFLTLESFRTLLFQLYRLVLILFRIRIFMINKCFENI